MFDVRLTRKVFCLSEATGKNDDSNSLDRDEKCEMEAAL